MSFILHVDSKSATLEDLRAIETPAGTSTWKPVPHIDVVESAIELAESAEFGYSVTGVQIGLNPNGDKMFAVLTLKSMSADKDMVYSIGLRNSHNKQFALGLVAGASVLVCDNMCFTGSFKATRKHTSGLDYKALIRDGLKALPTQWQELEIRVRVMKQSYIDDHAATFAVVDAAREGLIPKTAILDVLQIYREYLNVEHPHHEAFASRNVWSLYNAMTEYLKGSAPMVQSAAMDAIGSFFVRFVGKITEVGTPQGMVDVTINGEVANPEVDEEGNSLVDKQLELDLEDDEDYEDYGEDEGFYEDFGY